MSLPPNHPDVGARVPFNGIITQDSPAYAAASQSKTSTGSNTVHGNTNSNSSTTSAPTRSPRNTDSAIGSDLVEIDLATHLPISNNTPTTNAANPSARPTWQNNNNNITTPAGTQVTVRCSRDITIGDGPSFRCKTDATVTIHGNHNRQVMVKAICPTCVTATSL